MNKDDNVLSWLFDPFSMNVLMHFWSYKEFSYDKHNLIRIHEDADKLLASLSKLVLIKLVRMDNVNGTLRYKYNTDSAIGRAFESFMQEAININLNIFYSQNNAREGT
jgi:hypothetical protein